MSRNTIFPIGKMPGLAKNQVIRSMDTVEQIKLALTSRKMEKNVKMAGIKVSSYAIDVRNEISMIEIRDPEETILFCGNAKLETQNKITRNELEKYCDKGSVMNNLANVFKRVQYFLPCNEIRINLWLEWIKDTSLQEILSNPAFHNYETLCTYLGEIKSEDLKYIMEKSKPETVLILMHTTVPTDFRCDDAFKFRKITYHDARWVKVEDLFSLRDNESVILKSNNLNCSDFNALIKYWVHCDSHMFDYIKIQKDGGDQFENLFDGLVVLKCYRLGVMFYLVAAKFTENRKNPMLCIGIGQDELRLLPVLPDESIFINADNEYKLDKEFEILKLLERKEELENESIKTKERNQEIRAELRKLNDKLEKLHVRFENGRAAIG